MKLALAILLIATGAVAESVPIGPINITPEPYTDYNIAQEMPWCCGMILGDMGQCCDEWLNDNWGPFPPDYNEGIPERNTEGVWEKGPKVSGDDDDDSANLEIWLTTDPETGAYR